MLIPFLNQRPPARLTASNLWYNRPTMTKAKPVEIPVLITVHLETDNTIIHQRNQVFIVEKTDEVTQALQAVAQRAGKPVAEVLEQFSLDTVKDKLAEDEELQKIIKDFENKIKAKV